MQEDTPQVTDTQPKTPTGLKGVQDRFLAMLCRERTPVCIYLVNGIKLNGCIKAFDHYTIYLDKSVTQLVYKHSICSILPIEPTAVTTHIDTTETRDSFSTE